MTHLYAYTLLVVPVLVSLHRAQAADFEAQGPNAQCGLTLLSVIGTVCAGIYRD